MRTDFDENLNVVSSNIWLYTTTNIINISCTFPKNIRKFVKPVKPFCFAILKLEHRPLSQMATLERSKDTSEQKFDLFWINLGWLHQNSSHSETFWIFGSAHL